MTKPLTESQLRALREVAEGRVRYYRGELRYRSTEFPPAIRNDVAMRLRNEGLIRLERGELGKSWQPVVLTESGQMRLVAGA